MNAAYLPSAIFFSAGPATILISRVVTSAGKYILAGFWQPLTPQQMFDFTLVTHTVPEDVFTIFHIQAVSTHPASHCQMHLMQQLSVAPHCLNNCGQEFPPNVYSPFCSGTSAFQPLPSLSSACVLDSSRPNPQSSPLNSANAGSGLPHLCHCRNSCTISTPS